MTIKLESFVDDILGAIVGTGVVIEAEQRMEVLQGEDVGFIQCTACTGAEGAVEKYWFEIHKVGSEMSVADNHPGLTHREQGEITGGNTMEGAMVTHARADAYLASIGRDPDGNKTNQPLVINIIDHEAHPAPTETFGLTPSELEEAREIQTEEGGTLEQIAKRFDKHERSSN